jgi:predicted enzyme related to lactoylglutathione lyase
MANRKQVPGKFVWFELTTPDAKNAKTFYAEVLGWKAVSFPTGGATYEMIFAGETPDTMIGHYSPLRGDGRGSRWIASVSVEDVDAAVAAAAASGGKVLELAHDVPGVGRSARIADPAGAELALIKTASGDPPDIGDVPTGRFFWNELHTPDPDKALAFYEKAVGFAHRTLDMGPGGAYHIVSKGGVDRGGVTSHLPANVAPHWLPYVRVEDVDAAISRAKRLGARIAVQPEDIPGIGRFGVMEDLTGALLALMKPMPRIGS